MIIKKIVSSIISVFFLCINTACAQNWVTITAENGKSAELDLDNIQMVIDAVEYDIKIQDENYIYINKLSTELYKGGSPTAVIERTKYKDSISDKNVITREKISNRDYKELKSGTLQAEIFDVLSKEIEKKDFSKGKSTWKRYLKKQRKDLYAKWRPYKNMYSYASQDTYYTPVYENNATIVIDKDGIVQNSWNELAELSYVDVLDPLPENYTAKTFQLDVEMKYYKYAGAKIYTKRPVVTPVSPVRAKIKLAKNERPPVIGHTEFAFLYLTKKLQNVITGDWSDNALINLFIKFPIKTAACLAICGTGLFYLIVGGDVNDF